MKISYLTVGLIGTNCYLLCDEEAKVCAVVDPGGEGPRILAAIQGTGCVPCAVFLTHGHYDHTGAVEDLRERWPDLPVYLSAPDTSAAGAPRSPFPPVPDTRDYGEGDTVKVGNLTVEVLATPGHSKGSVTLRCGEALFTGDTLFAGDCGRTDLYGGDMREMLSSLRRLGSLPGDLLVLPGHMETSTLDRERQENTILRQALAVAL